MNIQDFLIEATKSIAREKIDKTQFTKSYIGTVLRILEDGECFVEINGVEQKCFIPLNMKHFVSSSDVVVVQDLFNDKTRRIVHGVVRGNSNIHIYNIITDTVVSSVLQIWNEDTGVASSTTFSF